MAVYYKGREINEIDYVKVEENIVEVNNQNKTIDITENGTQTITYDEGYNGLESVVINTNVETSSGGYEIPDGTKFGYSSWTELPTSLTSYFNRQTDMSYMFYNCSGLTSLDVSNFDTSNVTNMSGMFYYCMRLTSLDLSSFDTSNVTTMRQMFYNCSGLTSLDLSNFDTSNVTNIGYMFYNCSGLTSLNISGWNISNIGNSTLFYSFLFKNCSKLTSLILGDVTQEQYDWWYARLTDASIQDNVTITYNIIS